MGASGCPGPALTEGLTTSARCALRHLCNQCRQSTHTTSAELDSVGPLLIWLLQKLPGNGSCQLSLAAMQYHPYDWTWYCNLSAQMTEGTNRSLVDPLQPLLPGLVIQCKKHYLKEYYHDLLHFAYMNQFLAIIWSFWTLAVWSSFWPQTVSPLPAAKGPLSPWSICNPIVPQFQPALQTGQGLSLRYKGRAYTL